MKNLLKTFVVIALVAAIGFSMVACPEEAGNNKNNGNGTGSGDIDSALYGTWRNDNNTLIITFSSGGITWGGTVGNTFSYLPSGTKWTAKNGAISHIYSGTTTKAYDYSIDSSGKLILTSISGAKQTLTKDGGSDGGGGNWTPDGYSPIQLTENQWANGNITTSDGQQWFTFTCTQSGSSGQYIHVNFGTLTDLYVQVYDSYGDVANNNNESNISSTSSYYYTSRYLTSGKKYYIKVWPSGSGSGTYRIAFNRMWFSADYDSVNGFIFGKNTSTITIAGYTGPMNGAVNIPSTIDGKTVVSIGNGVFNGMGLTSVTIPNGVITIGDWAFGWNHLTSVTIPDSVTTIGDWAFVGDNLSPGGQMTSVIIPNSVTSIGGGAFWNHPLASVTIGANVELKTYYSNDGGGNNRDGIYHPFPNNFSSIYNPNKQAGTYIFNGTITIDGVPVYTGSWSKN